MRGAALILAAALAVGGCDHLIARRMVAPPNELRQKLAGPLEPISDPKDGHLRIAVGPPAALLSAWVGEPAGDVPVKGTVLVVHGFLADHGWMGYAAKALNKGGYRTVSVDLRGHGESTGKHITFGVVEARDLAQLTDYLQGHQLCGEKIGVWGVSLGAATAIQFAGIDKRVGAVVAVAPFASFREEVPHFARTMMPLPGAFLSKADFAWILARAGVIAGFDPPAADTTAAMHATQVPILLLHGDKDAIIPFANSVKLHEAGADHSELVTLHGEGHVAACFDWSGEVTKRAVPWFDRYLTGRGG